MKEVRWTRTAIRTLQETSDFILDIWNQKVNQDFIDQLEYRITQLRRNPELGPAYQDTNYRKLIIHKTVSLFYVNNPNYLKLLVIWDNRQDPAKLLKRLTDADTM